MKTETYKKPEIAMFFLEQNDIICNSQGDNDFEFEIDVDNIQGLIHPEGIYREAKQSKMKKKTMITVGALVICFALIVFGAYRITISRSGKAQLTKETMKENQNQRDDTSSDLDTNTEKESSVPSESAVGSTDNLNTSAGDNNQRFDDTSSSEVLGNTTNATTIENSGDSGQNSEQSSDTGERWTPYVR